MKKGNFLIVLICALAIGIVNYLVYPLIVDMTIKTIEIPVLSVDLKEHEVLTNDIIDYIEVPKEYISNDVILDVSELYGLSVKDGMTILKGSYLYKDYFEKDAHKEKELLITIPIDSVFTDVNLLEKYVDLYFIGTIKNDGISMNITGQIATGVKIKEKSKDSLTLIVDTTLFDYILKASKLGTIIPINVYVEASDNYYSQKRLFSLLDEYCIALKGVW